MHRGLRFRLPVRHVVTPYHLVRVIKRVSAQCFLPPYTNSIVSNGRDSPGLRQSVQFLFTKNALVTSQRKRPGTVLVSPKMLSPAVHVEIDPVNQFQLTR